MRKASLVASAFTVAAVLAMPPTVRAVDSTFRASVSKKIVRPAGCPDGAYLCGTAKVAGRGQAEYRWYLESFVPVSSQCGDYTATATFELADASVLTVTESGTDCGPGESFSAYPPFSYGQPQQANGEWTVTDGTGVFAGHAGTGTNEISVNGADFRASYSGEVH
jgi:hypothetical protein